MVMTGMVRWMGLLSCSQGVVIPGWGFGCLAGIGTDAGCGSTAGPDGEAGRSLRFGRDFRLRWGYVPLHQRVDTGSVQRSGPVAGFGPDVAAFAAATSIGRSREAPTATTMANP